MSGSASREALRRIGEILDEGRGIIDEWVAGASADNLETLYGLLTECPPAEFPGRVRALDVASLVAHMAFVALGESIIRVARPDPPSAADPS